MKYDTSLNLTQIPCLVLYGASEECLIDIVHRDINKHAILIDASNKEAVKTAIQNTRIDGQENTILFYNIGDKGVDSRISKINKVILVMSKLDRSFKDGLQVYCGGAAAALSDTSKQLVEKLVKCESILELKSGIAKLFKAKIELETISKYIIGKYKIRKTIREIVALAAECTRTRNMNSVEYYLLYERFFIKLRTFI
jgi:hypothetical protein